MLQHLAVDRCQVLGHDRVVLQLHLEGLHSGLEVGEDAGLGGQGHGGAGVPGTGGDILASRAGYVCIIGSWEMDPPFPWQAGKHDTPVSNVSPFVPAAAAGPTADCGASAMATQ